MNQLAAQNVADDREQYTLGTGRYILLIQHPTHGHWNGYTCLRAESWKKIRNLLPEELYDYEGPGSDRIMWVDMDFDGKQAIDLCGGAEAVWIGISGYAHRPDQQIGLPRVRTAIGLLERRLREILDAHSLA